MGAWRKDAALCWLAATETLCCRPDDERRSRRKLRKKGSLLRVTGKFKLLISSPSIGSRKGSYKFKVEGPVVVLN
ncbi:MAG: hypothetical protein OEP95_11395 [Myxococcales bacterium]|nr:hypothetical protein [Myxococcales bacterium]